MSGDSACSTTITSAPWSARIDVPNGPETTAERSMTRMPRRGPPSHVLDPVSGLSAASLMRSPSGHVWRTLEPAVAACRGVTSPLARRSGSISSSVIESDVPGFWRGLFRFVDNPSLFVREDLRRFSFLDTGSVSLTAPKPLTLRCHELQQLRELAWPISPSSRHAGFARWRRQCPRPRQWPFAMAASLR